MAPKKNTKPDKKNTKPGTKPRQQGDNTLTNVKKRRRYVGAATTGDDDLGPLRLLPGTWKNEPNFAGYGWNMIALPFPNAPFNYRLLVNQYNEELKFSLVDKAVPNRGLDSADPVGDADQFVVTLDYEQMIAQIAAEDFPVSGLAGGAGLAIHHEPGLFLHMLNERTDDLDIARLGTIPHGDSLLALGRSRQFKGGPTIPPVNGLPIGRLRQDVDGDDYFAPYRHFRDNPFMGVETDPTFPGFDPIDPHLLLEHANRDVSITRTTELMFDTEIDSGGISNIPFVVKQANAATMKSTFWIHEIDDCDNHEHIRLRLQYLQVITLDFFAPRGNGHAGSAVWPHVSINTLEKVVSTADYEKATMPY